MNSLVVIGAGGHSRVLIAALKGVGCTPLACVDQDAAKWNRTVLGVRIIGGESCLSDLGPTANIELVNAIGMTRSARLRRDVWDRLRPDYRFAAVYDRSAIVPSESEVRLGEGVQLLAGVILQVGVQIGDNSIINTGAKLDHDCKIGAHCHIAPGAVLCGDVRVGDSVFIGAGAIVKQGISIGAGVTVGMGAVVLKDVESGVTVAGNPARSLHAL